MRSLNTLLVISLLSSGTARSLNAAEPLLPLGADQWRYCDPASVSSDEQMETNWQAADYDDTHWAVGKALLGYGDPDVVTELASRDAARQKCTAVLFRRRFRVANLARFRLCRGRVCCDDGAVVYVNGREVFRQNMPAGELTFRSNAIRAVGPARDSERALHVFAVNSSDLTEGENVVAVSVHQANGTSSDLALDLELSGLDTEEEIAALRQQLDAEANGDSPVEPASLKLKPVSRIQVMAERRGE